MDKESGRQHHYNQQQQQQRGYEGLKSGLTHHQANNGNSTMVQPRADSGPNKARAHHHQGHHQQHQHQQPQQPVRCLCFGSAERAHQHSLLRGFLVNMGICSMLVVYTLFGSFLFLTIESRQSSASQQHQQQQRSLAAFATGGPAQRKNTTAWLKQMSHDARAKTVENLWELTVNLNILYRENWTKLAAQEISRFQDQLIKNLTEDIMARNGGAQQQQHLHQDSGIFAEKKLPEYDWNFARSFLYSLTVLTTIGYGCITPRSTLGKIVTMGYASLGIPLTLIYLSSAGGLLSRCARGVFTRALCCCLCSNCGYCCYDERQMQEKEKRMRKRRQQEELAQQQQQQQLQLQEPFYVRANASTTTYPGGPLTMGDMKAALKEDASSLGGSSGPLDHRPTVTIFAPIGICLGAMVCYIVGGAFTLNKLEGWSFVDASFFCFMSLSTIGFGDMVPGSYQTYNLGESRNITLWFCSCYIMSGMALTAMCFNILHDEIVHRLNHTDKQHQELLKQSLSIDELAAQGDPFVMTS